MADTKRSIRQRCGEDIFGAEAGVDARRGRRGADERGVAAGREGDGDRFDLVRRQIIAVAQRQRADGNGMAGGAAGKGLEGEAGRDDLPGCAPAGENTFRLLGAEGVGGIKPMGFSRKSGAP